MICTPSHLVLGLLIGVCSPCVLNAADSGTFATAADALIVQTIESGEASGAVVAVVQRQNLTFHKAYGHRQVEPQLATMTTDSVFDLASLTKPIVTGTAIALLVERQKLRYYDRVADHLPEFANQGKETVTVADLLLHQSGLIADNSMRDYQDGVETAWQRIMQLPLKNPPRQKFVYSDMGYIVLGKIVEAVDGRELAQFAREEIFLPLGMNDSGFSPPPSLCQRAVATEKRDDAWLVGQVHDPRAWALDGVAGHAGTFSTAADLARFACMMLGEGNLQGLQFLKPQSIRELTKPRPVPGANTRTYGWDHRSGFSSNRGALFSEQAYGHGGFTGTSLWIDPQKQLAVIMLTNRLHPDGKGSVNKLAAALADLYQAEDTVPLSPAK